MQCGNLLRVFFLFFPRGPNDRDTDGYKRRYKREGLRGQQMITFPLQHPGTRERRVSIQNEYALTGPQWQTSIMSQSMYRTEITPRSVLHLLVYSEWVYNQYAAVDIGGLLTQQGRRHLYTKVGWTIGQGRPNDFLTGIQSGRHVFRKQIEAPSIL